MMVLVILTGSCDGCQDYRHKNNRLPHSSLPTRSATAMSMTEPRIPRLM